MPSKLNVDLIRSIASKTLPGNDAHDLVMSYQRPRVEEVMLKEPKPKQSAVLILLYQKSAHWHIVLMKRNVYNGTHSGQISLPGGKKEKSDESLQFTALRESHEEIGIRPEKIELVTDISPIFIPPSNFIVNPFVGIAEDPLTFIPDPREVDRLIEMPLRYLLQDSSLIDSFVDVRGGTQRLKVKGFHYEDELIWGATAMILTEFSVMIKDLLR